ncbi:MAG: exodeoxyribonuclease V subunit gamma, partial [Thermodesulfobacteriota bacterium]
MFYLHRSNRSERLVRRLISLIADSKRPDPFTVEHFLIQSQGMERFLSQQLAAAFTAWCNFEYRHPVRFFDDLGRRLDLPPAENYQREQLAWRIDSLLRDLTGETFAPLLRYIHGEQEELKRFQLAGRLAHLFDQYQLMRPDMLEAWDKGRLVSQNPDEKWQALLWARLRREGHVGVFHRGEFLRELGRFLFEEQVDRSQLPARLFVFGLSSLPPLLLSCLYGLARHSDVHFFLLSPTNQYWGDMVRPITLARSRLQKATQDDDGLQCEPHPLLASMGSHGREFLELLLNSYEEIEDNEDFEEPAAKEGAGVLHQIQAGLYHGQPQPLEKVAGDDSIRIVSCHSRLRELEVLKEHVMGILHDHRDMTLSDIIVMTPKIQDYSLLIGQVFDDVPHSIGDRSLDRASRLPLLLLQFFQLARGRCGWSPVLDFLEMDEVYPGFGLCEPDLEKIRCWVTDAGIRWGLSPDHRAGFGLPPVNETSWQAGLERLMMGWAVSSKEAVNSIFPYLQIEGGRDGEILGGLCHYIETLSKGERDFSVSRSVQEWVELIFHYCEHLFGERDREGVERLRELMADLVKLLGDSYHHEVEAVVIEE